MSLAQNDAETIALQAVAFLLNDDQLRERFLALSGITPDLLKEQLQHHDFMASILEFFVQFEPDLLALAETLDLNPEKIIEAWRLLGGGAGQEW